MGRKYYNAVFVCLFLLLVTVVNYFEGATNEVLNEAADEAMDDAPKKSVYLTFDDGPSRLTPKVLDILKQYNINATFFMIGSQVQETDEKLIDRLLREGNKIGIHTYSHKYKCIYSSTDAFMEDFYKAREVIENACGEKVTLYRFPGGSCNSYAGCLKDELINRLTKEGVKCVDWNVSGEDSVGNPSAYCIYENVIKDVCDFDKPVILLHDSSINQNTVEALPDIIEYILAKGYTFEVISE